MKAKINESIDNLRTKLLEEGWSEDDMKSVLEDAADYLEWANETDELYEEYVNSMAK